MRESRCFYRVPFRISRRYSKSTAIDPPSRTFPSQRHRSHREAEAAAALDRIKIRW